MTINQWYGPVILGGVLFITGSVVPLFLSSSPKEGLTVEGTGKAQKAFYPDRAEIKVAATASLANSTEEVTVMIGDKIDKLAAYLDTKAGVEYSTDRLKVQQSVIKTGQKYARSFSGSQGLAIEFSDISLVNGIIDKSIELGIDDIGEVQFSLASEEERRKELRQLAIAAAREDAVSLASDLGMSIDQLVQFNDNADRGYRLFEGEERAGIVPEGEPPKGAAGVAPIILLHSVSMKYELQ